MTLEVATSTTHPARILDTSVAADREVLEALLADPQVEAVDRLEQQLYSLRQLRPRPEAELLAEPTRWVYYPWRRVVVHTLGPESFRRLRLDRNRNMITTAEQARLGELTVGIVGLSVGHAVAHTLAAEGLCGQLRLADFDELELSNLNRVPATVLDLGLNKATVAARRIAELDPYIGVSILTDGLSETTIDDFLDGLDVVIEECDSLDMKALVRQAARERRLPVLMATSDRGMVDIERFDLEPDRPVLHGLLGDTDVAALANLSSRQKVPHVLRVVDAAHGSARGAASMLELGRTISTWPQLAGDVIIGAAAVAASVRRIGLGEPLPSGRTRIDVGDALGALTDPFTAAPAVPLEPVADPAESDCATHTVAVMAARAPSGGNAQPWRIRHNRTALSVSIAPERSATVDVAYRSSAVAVGAAMYNARIAAAAHGVLGPVEWSTDVPGTPLDGVLRFAERDDPDLAALYASMAARETNRRIGSADPLDHDTVAALQAAARGEGGELTLLASKAELTRAAEILEACDRIRFLTPELHEEMRTEVRWPGDADPDTGIDVRSLELDPADAAALEILRRPDVMDLLAAWDAGTALGEGTRTRVLASSSLAVVTTTGLSVDGLLDYARGGSAAEAVWIAANQRGLAVHPCSPLFIHARSDAERHALSPRFGHELDRLAHDFNGLFTSGFATAPEDVMVIVFRLSRAAAPTVRSRRRPVRHAHGG